MTERKVSSKLSGGIVDHLLGRGLTLEGIGRLIGATKSFVSRVKNRQRCFTVEHLERLEVSLAEPLPYLLVEAADVEEMPPELRELYQATRRLLAKSAKVRSSLRAVAGAGSSR